MDYKKYNDYELIYMVRENDDFSYNTLLSKYLPIIKKIASEYYVRYLEYGYDYDDFLQEGYLGFQRAISCFDEKRDSLFYTFLVVCVRRCIATFCLRISCESKNISYSRFVDIDEIPVEDLSVNLDYDLLKKNLIKDMWDVVYDFNNIIYSAVFELRLNNFKYSEIGELLDISLKDVKLIQRKLCRDIRQKLEYNF